jgi:NitT/TauT family transport system substrate-binding protein
MAGALELWGVSDPNISAQLALAAKLNLFQQEAGLDVTCKFIESGTTMPSDILKAEQPPFAFTQTPITSLVLHEQHFPTTIVAPLADIAGTQQVIIHEDSGISSPGDLEGKRVGMAKGAAVYMAIKNMANDCQVTLDAMNFLHLMPHEQLTAFENREIDVIACWEPWTTKARTMGGVFYFSGTLSEIPGFEGDINWLINQSCLIIPDEHLHTQPAEVVAILKVLQKATDMLNADRKEMSKELAQFFGLSRVELMMAMQKNTYSMKMDTLFRIGVLGFRDFLHQNGRIATMYPEERLYTANLLKQAAPDQVTLEETAARNYTIREHEGIYYRDDVSLYSNGGSLRVVLADDSKFMRVTLKRVIKNLGGEVIGEATNGNEAIELFAQLRPNVITMDLSMPGVSGVDAIRSILDTDPTASIIVISGANLAELRQQVFDLGVKMFITKPFEPQKVTDVLSAHVS